ncbi:MAG: hypothetical protein AABY22_11560 [Nanoarchaeota archaeon]
MLTCENSSYRMGNYVERVADNLNSSSSVPEAIGKGLILGAVIAAPYVLYRILRK